MLALVCDPNLAIIVHVYFIVTFAAKWQPLLPPPTPPLPHPSALVISNSANTLPDIYLSLPYIYIFIPPPPSSSIQFVILCSSIFSVSSPSALCPSLKCSRFIHLSFSHLSHGLQIAMAHSSIPISQIVSTSSNVAVKGSAGTTTTVKPP
jgi:hypothetical protein